MVVVELFRVTMFVLGGGRTSLWGGAAPAVQLITHRVHLNFSARIFEWIEDGDGDDDGGKTDEQTLTIPNSDTTHNNGLKRLYI